MGTDLGSAPSYAGQSSVYTSVQEAEQGQGHDGRAAPEGTNAVAVEPGDTISGLMAQQGLDWTDKNDREQFLRDNPQFADGSRDPDLIWAGEVVYIRPPQGDETGGAGETGDAAEQPGSNSPEAKAVDEAQQDYDTAVSNYNAAPTDANWEALGAAREKLEAAIKTEVEADVAALDPPPATYEEHQQAVAESTARVAARYSDDTVVQAATQAVESELTSVGYLEGRFEEASQGLSPPAQEEASRINDLLQGARAVHESPEAKETLAATENLAQAEENLATQNSEGTPNEIKEAEEQVVEARERLEQAIAAEINARVEAAGVTDPEEVAAIEQQVRQDVLNRTDTGSHDAVNATFDGASQVAQTQRTTDGAATAYDSAQTSYDNKYGDGNLDMGHASAVERVESTQAALKSAVEAEIAAGIEDYTAQNPDASPEEIEAEAERLGEQIVSRNGDSEHVRDVVDTVVDDYN